MFRGATRIRAPHDVARLHARSRRATHSTETMTASPVEHRACVSEHARLLFGQEAARQAQVFEAQVAGACGVDRGVGLREFQREIHRLLKLAEQDRLGRRVHGKPRRIEKHRRHSLGVTSQQVARVVHRYDPGTFTVQCVFDPRGILAQVRDTVEIRTGEDVGAARHDERAMEAGPKCNASR